MTHPFLTDPENAKAYQTLCDHQRGSIRAWATKAGWTRSRMERFLLQLRAAGLAHVDVGLKGSTFVPVPDASRTRPAAGSKAVTTAPDKVPRSGEVPARAKQPIAEPDAVRLIQTANVVLVERNWPTLNEGNYGSLAGARKILKGVPVDRAVPLIEDAVRQFNPSATGGGTLQSLGHPFITSYVINEYRRTQRDLERGQLSMLFVEGVGPRPVYGARKHDVEELPPAKPETITAGVEEFRSLANSPHKPRRL
jgi:hypothetical protein